jgi:fluoride exporter
MMREIVLVFLGGGLGSVIRFMLGRWINAFHSHHFPWGTLGVNVVACALMGLLIGLADHRQLLSPSTRLFWTVGFCGGFSTFSAFSSEAITLIQNGFQLSFAIYLLASLVLCVAATYGGLWFGETI